MKNEILGYSIMVKVENDISDIEMSEYTKFGRICHEDNFKFGISKELERIVSLFNDFAKSKDARCIGLPFYNEDGNVVDQVTEKLLKELTSKIDKHYTLSAIEQINSGTNNVSNKYDFDDVVNDNGEELRIKFKYIVQVNPFCERDTGTNWVPSAR